MNLPNSEKEKLLRAIESLAEENRLLVERTAKFEDVLKKKNELETLSTELIENMPGAIYQFQVRDDGAYQILYLSKGADRLFEQSSSSELEFNHLLDFMVEEDKPAFLESIVDATSQYIPWSHEWRILTKSGRIKWLRGSSDPKLMDNGEYIWNGLLMDVSKQKEVEAALALNNNRYRQAQKIGKVGNWEYDVETTLFWGSEQAKEIYGFAPDADNFTTDEVENCIPERERIHQALIDLIESDKTYDLEFQINPLNSEQPTYISSKAELIRNDRGEPKKIVGVIQDITKRYYAEQALIKSLREKETLLQEIHHRVKNNMQIIASLLKLQLIRKDKQDVEDILKENMSRVYAMASIHESLHQSEKLSEIDFKDYLQNLSQMLSQTYQVDPSKVAFQIDVEGLKLGINKANPLGFVLNELISNSLKYAYPENQKGVISIKSNIQNGNTLELVIADDGIGLPEGFRWSKIDTLGLRLVKDIVENQLNGAIDHKNQNGAHFTIKFNLKSDYEK